MSRTAKHVPVFPKEGLKSCKQLWRGRWRAPTRVALQRIIKGVVNADDFVISYCEVHEGGKSFPRRFAHEYVKIERR